MKSTLVYLVLLGSVRGYPAEYGSEHILGGAYADPGEFPWMAAIWIDVVYFCGGSMISPYWILTAGHCTQRFSYFRVIMGAYDLDDETESTRQVRETTTKVVHPEFDPDIHLNDIALLRVATPFVSSLQVESIRLPRECRHQNAYNLRLATISGWGLEQDRGSRPTPILHTLDLRVITNSCCATVYPPDSIHRSHLCTNTTRTQAPCNGDSGGALTIVDEDGLRTQIGIDSYDLGECSDRSPEVFTRVSSFAAWIRENTGIRSCS